MSVPPLRPVIGGLLACVAVLAASVLSGSASLRALAGGGYVRAAGTPHVGLVVDFGTVTTVPGAPGPEVQTACVPVTAGAYGETVLHAAGVTIRWRRWTDLRPRRLSRVRAAGTDTANGYQYWSYWHGGSGWTYSIVGASSYRPSAGGVDGWHFVQGQNSASEGPPAFASFGPCRPRRPRTAAPGPSRPPRQAPPRPASWSTRPRPRPSPRRARRPPDPGRHPGPARPPWRRRYQVGGHHQAGSHGPRGWLPSHGAGVGSAVLAIARGPILVTLVIVGLVVVSC